jgi:hypothetical protein
MFRTLSAFVFGIALIAFVGAPAFADEKDAKEQKLVGKITCAKCDLGTADKCATVIKVGEKVYFFDKDGDKKYHAKICTAAMDGTVTGTVKKDGDKMIVTVTKLEFKK